MPYQTPTQFVINPSAKLQSLTLDDKLYAFETYNSEGSKVFKIEADCSFVIAYAEYTVNVTLEASAQFDKAHADKFSTDELIEQADFNFGMLEDVKGGHCIISKIAHDQHPLPNLRNTWDSDPENGIYFIDDNELLEDVLIAYCSAINKSEFDDEPSFSDEFLATLNTSLKAEMIER